MRKIELKRELLVPDSDYCIVWKNQKEVCTMLTFGKVAGKPNLVWKCTFFDKDIIDNINSFGIKKMCEDCDTKASVHNILEMIY